ncbi:MAG TPA: BTAD domain-containing putative transcriptional regulator, partial [Micromonosporaceae bacterium]|nr:BTAD domain-containing putative transcriptional regulator [Micromonosporaceae bacterium]
SAIRAEDGSLALSLPAVSLDAETFADYAEYGLGALRAGRDAEARAGLEAAERTYTGDFLEDDPYGDLAAPAREELRATFLAVVRALADLSRADGGVDDAARYLLRLLAVDGYDEPAHRSLIRVLVAGGRHGEARRARERFAAAMADLGVPADRDGRGTIRAG